MTRSIVGLVLAVAAVYAGMTPQDLRGEDAFYYRMDKKVALTLKPNKKYVLLAPDVTKQQFQETLESSQAVLVKFNQTKPPGDLALNVSEKFPSFKWAIINNLDAKSNPLTLDANKERVVYEAPFFVTPSGEEVGLSHLFYVKLKEDDDADELKALAEEHRVTVLGNNKRMPLWFTLACTNKSTGNALEVANKFAETKKFAAVQPDFMMDYNVKSPGDEHFAKQWGLKNSGQHGGTVGVDIQVTEAWKKATGASIVVAVVDHGIELNHPDMPNMFARSYDTGTGTSPSQVRGSHGTACAGIIGAARDNGTTGVAGIAPDVKLMSISNSLMLGPNVQQELADGLNWAWQEGAHVISNSWGHNALASALIDDAIDGALTQGRGGKGAVVVFAAGNNNGRVGYPANSNPDIIAVGAMSPCGERKSFTSCDGEPWGSNFGAELDIVAPGVLIPTTDRQGTAGYDAGDYALKFNGTSSACPHVAAVAALVLSLDSSLTQKEVADIIEKNGQKVGTYTYQDTPSRPHGKWHHEMGYGLVNAKACVEAVAKASGEKLASAGIKGGEKKNEAARYEAAEGLLQSLPQGPDMKGERAEDDAASAAGFSWYNNVGVNLNTGLLGTSGTTQISVYARDIRWKYAFGSAPNVTTPGGDGGTAGSGWTFPNAHRFGITIFQGNNYWNVTSTSSASPTVITGLSNTQDIRIMVNDTNGNYSDNSGAFDIYIRKDN